MSVIAAKICVPWTASAGKPSDETRTKKKRATKRSIVVVVVFDVFDVAAVAFDPRRPSLGRLCRLPHHGRRVASM